MADVAKAACVHQTTVSLALRNDIRLPAATKERIVTIAEDLGYRPNPLVSALISERKHKKGSHKKATLAFMTAFAGEYDWRKYPNYEWLYRELVRYARKAGYEIEIFWLKDPAMPSKRLEQILLARAIRGILVAPLPGTEHQISFNFTPFAAVGLGHHVTAPRLDQVAVDYFSLMQKMIDRLLETGHHRIAFATTQAIDARVNHRMTGCYLAARKLNRQLLPVLFSAQWWSQPQVKTWLRSKRPDAIIVPTFADFQFFAQCLKAEGADIPAQTSLLNANCYPDAAEAGMQHSIMDQAAAAIQLLTRKVERAQFGIPQQPQTVLVGSDWHSGVSMISRECLA